jgi:hypothetical protein
MRIGVSLPGPLRQAGLPRSEPAAGGTGRGGASAAALIDGDRRSAAVLMSQVPFGG